MLIKSRCSQSKEAIEKIKEKRNLEINYTIIADEEPVVLSEKNN